MTSASRVSSNPIKSTFLRAAGTIFWTQERLGGAREISRNVELETIPLYIRAGSILPLGPVKQFTGEKTRCGLRWTAA
jgi:alpha-glucosidase (family GH31 glycosyl hydrolase)